MELQNERTNSALSINESSPGETEHDAQSRFMQSRTGKRGKSK